MFRNNLIGVQTAQAVNQMNQSTPSYGFGNALADALKGYQQGKQLADEKKAREEQAAWEKERFGIEQDNTMKRHDDQLAQAYMQAQNQQAQWDKQNQLDWYQAQKNYELQQANTPLGKALAYEDYRQKYGDEAAQSVLGELRPLTEADKVRQREQAKIDVEREKNEKLMSNMLPSLNTALDRGTKAAESGTGLGLIGGYATKFGANLRGKAGQNYSSIQTANAQMNQYLRAHLAVSGLTGQELNSAVEANAYRYTIDPTDDEDVILAKINQFKADYLGNGQVSSQQYKDKYGL